MPTLYHNPSACCTTSPCGNIYDVATGNQGYHGDLPDTPTLPICPERKKTLAYVLSGTWLSSDDITVVIDDLGGQTVGPTAAGSSTINTIINNLVSTLSGVGGIAGKITWSNAGSNTLQAVGTIDLVQPHITISTNSSAGRINSSTSSIGTLSYATEDPSDVQKNLPDKFWVVKTGSGELRRDNGLCGEGDAPYGCVLRMNKATPSGTITYIQALPSVLLPQRRAKWAISFCLNKMGDKAIFGLGWNDAAGRPQYKITYSHDELTPSIQVTDFGLNTSYREHYDPEFTADNVEGNPDTPSEDNRDGMEVNLWVSVFRGVLYARATSGGGIKRWLDFHFKDDPYQALAFWASYNPGGHSVEDPGGPYDCCDGVPSDFLVGAVDDTRYPGWDSLLINQYVWDTWGREGATTDDDPSTTIYPHRENLSVSIDANVRFDGTYCVGALPGGESDYVDLKGLQAYELSPTGLNDSGGLGVSGCEPWVEFGSADGPFAGDLGGLIEAVPRDYLTAQDLTVGGIATLEGDESDYGQCCPSFNGDLEVRPFDPIPYFPFGGGLLVDGIGQWYGASLIVCPDCEDLEGCPYPCEGTCTVRRAIYAPVGGGDSGPDGVYPRVVVDAAMSSYVPFDSQTAHPPYFKLLEMDEAFYGPYEIAGGAPGPGEGPCDGTDITLTHD